MSAVFEILFVVIMIYFIMQMSPIGVKQMDTDELRTKLQNKEVQLLDVRTENEFAGRSIRGAKNIPLHTLKKRIIELNPSIETAVICQSGMRSLKASKLLQKHNFINVKNVRGGMNNWK